MNAKTQMAAGPVRLREQPTALGQALELAARRSGHGRIGARERVWRGVAAPRQIRWYSNYRWLSASAVSAVAIAAVIFFARTPGERWQLSASTGLVEIESGQAWQPAQTGTALPLHAQLRVGPNSAAVLSHGSVRLALGADSRLALGDRPALQAGACAVAISGEHHFQMAAGAYQIDAGADSGGVFLAEASAMRVRIHSEDARLHVSGASGDRSLGAGENWSDASADTAIDPSLVRPLAALSRGAQEGSAAQLREVALYRPASKPAAAVSTDARKTDASTAPAIDAGARLLDEAHAAESAQHYSDAASLYAQLAGSDPHRAPTALYELARVRLRFLNQPAAALSALDEERAKFPAGPLAQEVALSSIEARLALGADGETMREMSQFLATFSGSERAPEIRWLRASIELKSACSAARSDLAALESDAKFGGEALFAEANCAGRAGDVAAQKRALRGYLERYPDGQHHREAASLLGGEPRGAP